MTEISLKSDVAGRVWMLAKREGDPVAPDEAVVVIEAMKMEIPIAPDKPGRILRLLVAEGDQVEEDQPVATIELAS